MKTKFTLFFLFAIAFNSFAQIEFTNANQFLNNSSITSGVAIGVADLNGDGLDDIIRLNNARNLVIGYQRLDGEAFDHYPTDFAFGSQWSLAVADVDKNGYNDIYAGGAYNGLRIALFDEDGIDTVILLPQTSVFAQAANFADINNDGEIDLFVCHDDGVSAVYENNGDAEFAYNLDLINTSSTIPSDNSGNYGSVWTDYDSDGDLDLYISKCRLSVTDSMDGRRVNLLFENDGNNNYADSAMVRKIVPYGQSWSTDFGDIDNDGDLDAFVINHDKVSTIYENIDNTTFVDITATSGIVEELDAWGVGIQVVFDDFDNDGYIDIATSGIGGSFIFKNNGDKTFANADPFPNNTPNMQSLAVGDLNNDGFLDLIGGFANGYNSPSNNPDRMFYNGGNSNNFYKIILEGKTSNFNGIGARVELYAGGMMQIREVRSGEGYGIMNSLTTHFGIGTATSIDSVVVKWPSGVKDVICNAAVNTTKKLVEGCNANCAGIITAIFEQICAGDAYSFDGNEITESGNYTATFTTQGGCDSTVQLELTVFEVDNGISSSVGNENVLEANANNATYQWINCNDETSIDDATNQIYEATESGNYAVIVTQNGCSDTSTCLNITISSTLNDVFGFNVDVYPNPIQDYLNVRLGNTIQEVNFEIVDVLGKVYLSEVERNINDYNVNLKQLPKGVYILNVTIGDQTGSIKLLKQ